MAKNDAAIILALNDLKKRKFKCVRTAAGHHKVSHMTLLRRWKGGKTIAESCEDQQNLIIAEEKALERWITCMTATGNPVSHDHIREMAQEIHNNRAKRLEDPADMSNIILQSASCGLSAFCVDILTWLLQSVVQSNPHV